MKLIAPAVMIAGLAIAAMAAPAADAAVRCFGQPTKVINQPGTYRLDRHEAVFVNATARIIGRGDNRICGKRHRASISLGKGTRNFVRMGAGNDLIKVDGPTRETRIHAGHGDNRVLVGHKAARHVVVTGNGSDRIVVRGRAKASARVLHAGLGNDRVRIAAKGNTRATLGGRGNPRNLPNDNRYRGGISNDDVTVFHGDNTIHGNGGSDTIRSLGNANSEIFAGNGTDFVHSNGGDEIFGGRGQDRLLANQGTSIGPVYADGGPGDDTLYGTSHDDVLVNPTGGNQVFGLGGDDAIRVGDGPDVVDGGPGDDTLSFAAHTPPGWEGTTGVKVDMERGLGHGSSLGSGFNNFKGIRRIIGSSFNDEIITDPRRPTVVDAGLGNDEIESNHPDDVIDHGPSHDPSRVAVNLSDDGLLTVLGTPQDDQLMVSHSGSAYKVSSSVPMSSVGPGCEVSGRSATCSAPLLTTILAYTARGNDRIAIDRSVPAEITTKLDAADGDSVVQGGRTDDYLSSDAGRSRLVGAGGVDIFQVSSTGRTHASGGPGPDVFKLPNPCLGHEIVGGPGKDGLVFAQSDRPVEVNLTRGIARLRDAGSCTSTQVAPDVTGAEGTSEGDLFIGSPRARNGFFGRQGIDTFDTRHRTRDSIITGPPGRKNRVFADPNDRVTYGWGFGSVGS